MPNCAANTSDSADPAADNRPIGVFDSGLGGLTVVAALRRRLPDEDILYLGDTARVPYGDKSADSIIRFARQDTGFLVGKGVKLVIAACNTVSAVALPELRRNRVGEPLLGVIDAGVRAVMGSGARRICVIGTRATVNSDAYRRALHALDRSLVVESIPCPLLVPLAEEGIVSGPLARAVFDLYLKPLRENPPEALLLGCTHYPLFIPALNKYFGGRVRIIDSAGACAEYAADYLQAHRLSAVAGKRPRYSCFVTDLPAEFQHQATRFLGSDPGRVEKIALE